MDSKVPAWEGRGKIPLGGSIGVFPKIRVPQNGWFIMEKPY